MPIEVACPACSGRFHAPDDSAGKAARCPTCGGAIDIPQVASSDEVVDAEIAGGDVAGTLTEGSAAGPRKPCPMCGEMISTSAVKCRFCGEVFDARMAGVLSGAGDMRDPGWQKVRSGLNTMYNCIITIVIAGIFLVIALAISGAAAAPQPQVSPVAAIAMIICGLVVFGAGIGVVVGQAQCTNVPQKSGARGLATGSVICLVINFVTGMVGGATQMPAISAVGNLVAVTGSILFILFIRRTAAYLGNQELASSAGNFLIFTVIVFVAAFAIGIAAAVAQKPAVLALLVIAILVMGLISFVWYLRLLKTLMTTVEQRTGAR